MSAQGLKYAKEKHKINITANAVVIDAVATEAVVADAVAADAGADDG